MLKLAVIFAGLFAFSCIFSLGVAQVIGHCSREQEAREDWAEALRRQD